MELSKWVVRVYLKKNSGTYILGTGIPVLRGYILTATHVLKDDRELRDQEIIIQDYQGNDTQHLSVEDIAYLSDANDLALIRSNHFDRIAEKFPVSISLPRVDQRFHSSAFPSFIAKDDAVNVFPLSGALLHTTGDSLESLTVDQGVVNREQWRGASGAPVIAGGCIVGVLSKVPKYTNNTMSYTSIRSVYDADERFKQFFEAKETDQKFIQYVNRMAIKQFEKVSESFLEEWCIEASIDDVDENYATQLVAFQDIEDLFTSLNQVLSRPGVLLANAELNALGDAARWLVLKSFDSAVRQSILRQIDPDNLNHMWGINWPAFLEVPIAIQRKQRADYDVEGGQLFSPNVTGTFQSIEFESQGEEEVLVKKIHECTALRVGQYSQPSSVENMKLEIDDFLNGRYGRDEKSIIKKRYMYFFLSDERKEVFEKAVWFNELRVFLQPQLRFVFVPSNPSRECPQRQIINCLTQIFLCLEAKKGI